MSILDNLETAMPNSYNPNQLVTYKVIDGDTVSYSTIKTVDLEYELDKYRQYQLRIKNHIKLMSDIEEGIIEWYNPNYDKEEVLAALCELLSYTPSKEITINANLSVEVIVQVPVDEVADFDAQSVLNDCLSMDYNGDGFVNSHYVDSVDIEF